MRTDTPGARFRRLVGVPEPEVVYWTPDPEHPVSKVCTMCGEEKPFPEFYLRYQTGRRVMPCRACARERRRARRQEHLAECRAHDREYYGKNAERLRARQQERRAADREHCRELTRRSWAAHAVERRAGSRQYYADHADRLKARSLEWHRRHAQRVRELRRAYRERHPDRVAARLATHYLRTLGVIERPDRCTDCGGKATEHHHPDYAKPLDVLSLCHPCHTRRHFAVWRRTGGGPVKYPEEYGSAGVQECKSGGVEE